MNQALLTAAFTLSITFSLAGVVALVRLWGRVGNLETAFQAYQKATSLEISEMRQDVRDLKNLCVQILTAQASGTGKTEALLQMAGKLQSPSPTTVPQTPD